MNYTKTPEDIHLKFNEPNILIGYEHNIDCITSFKFDYINDTIYKYASRKTEPSISNEKILTYYKSLINDLKLKMGLMKTIHDLKYLIVAINGMDFDDMKTDKASILIMKKTRLENFYDELCIFILRITHILFWNNYSINSLDEELLEYEQSGKTFIDCFEFSMKIGNTIRDMFEKEFDDDFNTDYAVKNYIETIKKTVSNN